MYTYLWYTCTTRYGTGATHVHVLPVPRGPSPSVYYMVHGTHVMCNINSFMCTECVVCIVNILITSSLYMMYTGIRYIFI